MELGKPCRTNPNPSSAPMRKQVPKKLLEREGWVGATGWSRALVCQLAVMPYMFPCPGRPANPGPQGGHMAIPVLGRTVFFPFGIQRNGHLPSTDSLHKYPQQLGWARLLPRDWNLMQVSHMQGRNPNR